MINNWAFHLSQLARNNAYLPVGDTWEKKFVRFRQDNIVFTEAEGTNTPRANGKFLVVTNKNIKCLMYQTGTKQFSA